MLIIGSNTVSELEIFPAFLSIVKWRHEPSAPIRTLASDYGAVDRGLHKPELQSLTCGGSNSPKFEAARDYSF